MDATTPPSRTRQVEYDIRAPTGGMGKALSAFMSDDEQERPNHLDLKISRKRGHTAHVRVYPDRDTVEWDGTFFKFFGGYCAPLVDGEETEPMRSCNGRINTEPTDWEAGKLIIGYDRTEEIL